MEHLSEKFVHCCNSVMLACGAGRIASARIKVWRETAILTLEYKLRTLSKDHTGREHNANTRHSKTIPYRAAHTFLAHIWEYPPVLLPCKI